MSSNRRMKPNRAKTASDLIKNTPGASRSGQARPRPSPAALAEQIHELECFIAAAPRISRQQRLARRNYLPPLEGSPAARRQARPQRMPMQNVIALKRYRLRLLTELGLLGLAFGGVLGWLHHWLGLNHLLGFFR